MTRPWLLDTFCKAGGATRGYQRAGFRVFGVDIAPQPNYVGDDFHQGDALEFTAEHSHEFDAIHASPPCQDHSTTKALGGHHGTGWMLAATRAILMKGSVPWVIENVDGAPLARQPDLFGANGLELCGCMFPELRGLLYEARLFETSFPVPQLSHCRHRWPQTKMGRPPQPGECMQVTGHFSGVAEAQRRMGADWMTQGELAQAIPPAYTEYVGACLLKWLAVAA
jgi:DNA (cytosine-5)-methyltransferase 1